MRYFPSMIYSIMIAMLLLTNSSIFADYVSGPYYCYTYPYNYCVYYNPYAEGGYYYNPSPVIGVPLYGGYGHGFHHGFYGGFRGGYGGFHGGFGGFHEGFHGGRHR